MIQYIGKYVADISDRYERLDGQIKLKNFKANIALFRSVVGKISTSRGFFGTGYPFYATDSSFSKDLPIIDEQIRYNDELRMKEEERQLKTWPCELCLRLNGDSMPDLKQICKPCPRIVQDLKPRKVINRLPDFDMWLVCEDGTILESAEQLKEELDSNNFITSDIDPVKTIEGIKKMVDDLEKGKNVDSHLLPIDAHIIEHGRLRKAIEGIPTEIGTGVMNENVPYIPIHPLSLRKIWQYDDTAYNFVHDFLLSFTEYNMDSEMQCLIDATRKVLASTYSNDELYHIFLQTADEGTRRRMETKELQKRFEERNREWRRL